MKMFPYRKTGRMVVSQDKHLYRACVKTIHYQHLNVRDSDGQWFESDVVVQESHWKGGGGGLQWRTNRHNALLNVSVMRTVLFVRSETVDHLCIETFGLIENWSVRFIGHFNQELFIFGPKFNKVQI